MVESFSLVVFFGAAIRLAVPPLSRTTLEMASHERGPGPPHPGQSSRVPSRSGS